MDQRSPSFEASLLYRTPPAPADASVMEDLIATIEINGEALQRIDEIDDMFTVLTCNKVQILLAFSHNPLPVTHFLNANRPGDANVSENQIIARLSAIVATTTVLVVDREVGSFEGPLATAQSKHDLCWEITECLFDQDPVDLVFWSDDDMLYADEEFERACEYPEEQEDLDVIPDAEPAPEPANVHWIFEQEPVVNESALAGVGKTPRQTYSDMPMSDIDEVATVLPFTMPDRIAQTMQKIRANLDPKRAAHGAALACTAATITMTALPNLETLLM